MGLFEYNPEGFQLHSGGTSHHRINCEALSDDDLFEIASSISQTLGGYKWIIPVMRGGLRFASVLAPLVYVASYEDRVLIVDDVWTTGASVKEAKDLVVLNDIERQIDVRAVVLFARSPVPDYVTVATDPWMKRYTS